MERGERPWGTYTVLDENTSYKIKRIEVLPGQRLSLQKHHHRSEHWIVVSGTALVTCGEGQQTVNVNESTFIPIGQNHRLENPGKIPLVIIEVQSGEYLGEDDIIRFNDDYNRCESPSPDKQDKCVSEVNFCQKNAENNFKLTNAE